MRKTSCCVSASQKESIEIRLKLERAALSTITVDLKIEVSLNKHVTYYQLTCIQNRTRLRQFKQTNEIL